LVKGFNEKLQHLRSGLKLWIISTWAVLWCCESLLRSIFTTIIWMFLYCTMMFVVLL